MKLTVTCIIVCVCLTFVCSSVLMSEDFMYWESNFADIDIVEHITAQNSVVSGSSVATLNMNGDVSITSNKSNAQLTNGSDTLVTEYKLTFDHTGGDGYTGSSTVDWTDYNTFLDTAAVVTYVPDDNDVVVTLHVRASNYADDVADAGTYTATQELTAHWVGP